MITAYVLLYRCITIISASSWLRHVAAITGGRWRESRLINLAEYTIAPRCYANNSHDSPPITLLEDYSFERHILILTFTRAQHRNIHV